MGDVSRSSITLSSASYASSLFPVVDDDAAVIIEAILARVSPDEAEWKPFLQAYDDIFQERGLDRQSDTVIYDLILKLGLQSGRNWRAKWENVKKVQEQQQSRGDKRVDQAAARTVGDAKLFNRANAEPEHTGYRTPGHAHHHHHHHSEDLQPRLTREALDELQHAASPYKPAQTPFQSQDRARAEKRDGTTPRVHFAHDVYSQRSYNAADVFGTPDNTTPHHSAEDRELMLREAIQFDRSNLLGRMYDDWLTRFFVLKRLQMHTAIAHDATLKRRSLHFWAERVQLHSQLNVRAQQAYSASLQRGALTLWTQKLQERRRTVWEKEMAVAFRSVTRKKAKQLKDAAFEMWREKAFESRAFRFRLNHLLKATLGKWLTSAARLAEMNLEGDALQAQRELEVRSDAFARWKSHTILLVREAEAVEDIDYNLQRRVLALWRNRASYSIRANYQLESTTQRKAFATWKERLRHLRALADQARSLSRARDEDTQERAFHTWKIREHSRLLERAKSVRLARSTFQHWRFRLHAVTEDLDKKADFYVKNHQAREKQSVLGKWRASTRNHQKAMVLASSLHDRLQLQRSFGVWRKGLAQHKLGARRADVANDFFVQRRCLRVWVKSLRWVQANKVVAMKERQVLQSSLTVWRSRARRQQHLAILEEGISAAIDQRIVSSALKSWTNRVIELRSRVLTITHERDSRLLQGAMSHWVNRAQQCSENLSLVDSFIEVQEEDILRIRFRKWASNAKRKRLLRERLEQKLEENHQNLLTGAFDHWVDRYREGKLVYQEESVLRYRTYQTLSRMLQLWKSKSITVPAILFDANRQRRAVFDHWRKRLPERQAENAAALQSRQRLLRSCLSVWRERAEAKASERAMNRFRAFATGSPLARPNSNSRRRLAVPSEPSFLSSHRAGPSRTTISLPASGHGLLHAGYSPHPRTALLSPSPTPSTGIHTISRLRQEAASPRRTPSRQAIPKVDVPPESVALPPSSSATGLGSARSSTPSSPSHVRLPVPLLVPNSGGDDEDHQQSRDGQRQPEGRIRIRRPSNRSRDAFEEGVLRDIRERLAATGLGSRVNK